MNEEEYLRQRVDDQISWYSKKSRSNQKYFKIISFIEICLSASLVLLAVKCLYYINGSYQPAEDRFFYYSYSLMKLPPNYTELMIELQQQQIDSYEDYKRRENLFKTKFLSYLENQLG